MNQTRESLRLTQLISDKINNQTFHHHYHILYDIAETFTGKVNYVEIGCYAGGSACLMLQRPNTNVISIDLGYPISPDIVKGNVDNLNIHNNQYTYIQGNSSSTETYMKLKSCCETIDILFIDGDHSYMGVKRDFEMYSQLVNPGGYIIFDDYNDSIHSPEVKYFVDDCIQSPYIQQSYNIIGNLPNIFHARPSDLVNSNCFIIQLK